MDQKLCKTCGVLKNKEDFPFWNKIKNILRPHCKVCFSEKRREWHIADKDNRNKKAKESYNKHKESRILGVRLYAENNPDKIKKWVNKHRVKKGVEFHEWKKTLKCSKCDENHVACLEFHHTDPDKKEYLISKIKSCRNKLQEELKKCIVLCCNCHRKLHYQEKIEKIENNNYVYTKEDTTNQGES